MSSLTNPTMDQEDPFADKLFYRSCKNNESLYVNDETAVGCISTVCYQGTCVMYTQHAWPALGYCECFPGWTGTRCDQCCDLPCQNDGKCEIDTGVDSDYMFCNCAMNRTDFTGPLCDLVNNGTDYNIHNSYTYTQETTAIIVSTVLVVVLGASIFSTLYGMYKKRHPWLIKYIIQYHNRFIDDSNRRYDAFLSYQSSCEADRKFVVFRLLPYLEERGYTACIDQRDFIPGAAIANTIAEAIQESKRTILVLSPAYVEGEWPEFEIQCALKESLKKNHRVIPVLLRSIDSVQEQVSSSLHHILESITYIEWPEDDEVKETDFWKRLILALPKKAVSETGSESSQHNLKSVQSQTSQSSQNGLLDTIAEGKRKLSSSNLFNKKALQNLISLYRSKTVHPEPNVPNIRHPELSRNSKKKIAVTDFSVTPKRNTRSEDTTPKSLNMPHLVTGELEDVFVEGIMNIPVPLTGDIEAQHNESMIENDQVKSIVNNNEECITMANLDKVDELKYIALKVVC